MIQPAFRLQQLKLSWDSGCSKKFVITDGAKYFCSLFRHNWGVDPQVMNKQVICLTEEMPVRCGKCKDKWLTKPLRELTSLWGLIVCRTAVLAVHPDLGDNQKARQSMSVHLS